MKTNPIATRIEALLNERGETRADLCRKTGIKYHALNPLWIRPNAKISADNAAIVARYLGTTISYIIHGIEPAEAPPADGLPDELVTIEGFDSVTIDDRVRSTPSVALPHSFLERLPIKTAENLAVIEIVDDGMALTIGRGDLAVVDLSKRDLGQDGLVALRDQGQSTLVKRVGRASHRDAVTLISDNHKYLAVERQITDLTVIGRVLLVVKKV